MTKKHVAVIDIGKTNAKLTLVDLDDLSEIAVVTRQNKVLPGPPWPHFDVDGHWEFLLSALRNFHAEHGIDAISITTHGACVALLNEMGNLAAPILDYEYTGPDDVADEYDMIRPPFSETGSPKLPMGLNVGAQLFWQFHKDAGLKDRIASIVTYPQYWGHRLTGVAATDATSLGCHTDLWNPQDRKLSSLPERLGITDKIAPTCISNEVLGNILAEVANCTGLSFDTPVHCGIHDSNASLLPHILSHEEPFSVVSTGTWVIAMSIGGKKLELNPAYDTLINVNAFGDPVPSARFMGGREYDLATGGISVETSDEDIEAILRDSVMLLPTIVPHTGPFMGRQASWRDKEPAVGSGARAAAIGFYLALVTARCLELIGHTGLIIVEGPFAKNRCYHMMLSAVTGSKVHAMNGATGTSQGAAILHSGDLPVDHENVVIPHIVSLSMKHLLKRYSEQWQKAL